MNFHLRKFCRQPSEILLELVMLINFQPLRRWFVDQFLDTVQMWTRPLGSGSQRHTDGRLLWPALWTANHMAVGLCRNWRVKSSIHDVLRLLTTSHGRAQRVKAADHSCAPPILWRHTAAVSAAVFQTTLFTLSKPSCFPGRRLEDAWKTWTPLAKCPGRHGSE